MSIVEWIRANPVETIAVVAYLIANFAPRPHPDDHTGWKRALWLIIDRICVITHDKVPMKMPLLGSPRQVPLLGGAEAKPPVSDKNSAPEPEVKPEPDDGPVVEVDGGAEPPKEHEGEKS